MISPLEMMGDKEPADVLGNILLILLGSNLKVNSCFCCRNMIGFFFKIYTQEFMNLV